MWYCHVHRKKELKPDQTDDLLSSRQGYTIVDFAIRVEDPGNIVTQLSGGNMDGTYMIDDDFELSFDSEMFNLCLYRHLVTIKVVHQEVPDGESMRTQAVIHVETSDGMAMSFPMQNNFLDLFANSFVWKLLPDNLELY